ncbi:MAG: M56 family metallopeptidase [Armatimonadetes bacterium]|nr:M56 family metallopeptidase [Armatimonadota bacterium]
MNWWSAIMEAVPAMGLFAGAVGLLLWVALALPGISARGKMGLALGLVGCGVFGSQVVGIVGNASFVPGPPVFKYGPSRAEIDDKVSARVWALSDAQAVKSPGDWMRATDAERAKYLPPRDATWFYIGGMAVGVLSVAAFALRARKALGCSRVAPDWILEILGEVDQSPAKGRECLLALSDSATVPWSLAPKWIVLPSAAIDWPEQEVRLALRHEVAHLRKGHGFATLGAALLACLGWCFPWMWPLPRLIRNLAERAADESVLAHGGDRIAYAELLLRLGREVSGVPRTALPMVESGGLKSRVSQILHGRLESKDWGRRGVVAGIFLASLLGLMIGLSARSYGMQSVAGTKPYQRILELTPQNRFRAKDRDGFTCQVESLVQMRDGKLMRWTPAGGWVQNTEELGLYQGSIESGNVLLTAKIDGWPSIEGDRAYSLSNGNAVAWDGRVSTMIYSLNVARGLTDLVYSRSPWQEVGRMELGGVPQGRIAGFKGLKFRQMDQISRNDLAEHEFLVDYGQIMVPSTPPFEFSYDWQVIDRGATDRRVVFVMKDGRREATRQFMVDQRASMRETWRAYVDGKDVAAVVMEERPVLRLDISGLPCAQ